MFLSEIVSPETFAASVASPGFAAPLSIACVAIIVALPVAAARSHLHIPGYVGLAFLSFALALLCGGLSGTSKITGTLTGIALSLLFFLLVAVTIGSLLALFFYRDLPRDVG
jgi:hypothetical protein